MAQLKPYGLDKHPAEGPIQHSQRISQNASGLPRQLFELIQLYVSIRYGKSPQGDDFIRQCQNFSLKKHR